MKKSILGAILCIPLMLMGAGEQSFFKMVFKLLSPFKPGRTVLAYSPQGDTSRMLIWQHGNHSLENDQVLLHIVFSHTVDRDTIEIRSFFATAQRALNAQKVISKAMKSQGFITLINDVIYQKTGNFDVNDDAEDENCASNE